MDWPYEITLIDSENRVVAQATVEEKPKSVMPGKTQEILFPWAPMDNLPYGEYRICLGIRNPATGAPAIEFPHTSIVGSKRYPVAVLYHSAPAAG